jgi:RNA polymerase sigma-70 factor (ECF subfamily)
MPPVMASTASDVHVDTHVSDADLVVRCRMHDESAVRELTRRYNQRLYRLARGILRDDAEAEDVVQETYVRAFTHLEAFRGDAGIGTWLVRIAMNEAFGRLKRRRPTLDIQDAPEAAGGENPESVMAQRELRTVLERSIDALPDAFRAVFVARIVEGLTIEETAALFDLRPETVKTRVHRARLRLRAAIEREVGPAWLQAFSFDGRRCERLTDAVVRRLRPAAPREPSRPSAI